jgi:hypothetical protein
MTMAEAVKALEQDDWDTAHRIVQNLEGATAAWLHGIVHLMEGDEPNARYWYRQAGRTYPGKAEIQDEIRAARASLGR